MLRKGFYDAAKRWPDPYEPAHLFKLIETEAEKHLKRFGEEVPWEYEAVKLHVDVDYDRFDAELTVEYVERELEDDDELID
jgi:hypothetical protein